MTGPLHSVYSPRPMTQVDLAVTEDFRTRRSPSPSAAPAGDPASASRSHLGLAPEPECTLTTPAGTRPDLAETGLTYETVPLQVLPRLWRAQDAAEMQAILKSLPLDAW